MYFKNQMIYILITTFFFFMASTCFARAALTSIYIYIYIYIYMPVCIYILLSIWFIITTTKLAITKCGEHNNPHKFFLKK